MARPVSASGPRLGLPSSDLACARARRPGPHDPPPTPLHGMAGAGHVHPTGRLAPLPPPACDLTIRTCLSWAPAATGNLSVYPGPEGRAPAAKALLISAHLRRNVPAAGAAGFASATPQFHTRAVARAARRVPDCKLHDPATRTREPSTFSAQLPWLLQSRLEMPLVSECGCCAKVDQALRAST